MSTQATPAPVQTESGTLPRNTRLLDGAMVLIVALAYPFLGCAAYFVYGGGYATGGFSTLREISGIMQEAIALAVLAWVLSRQGRGFRDLGWSISFSDFVPSIGLALGAYVAFLLENYIVQRAYLFVTGHYYQPPVVHVFDKETVAAVAVLFVTINPWFEELIVRAFLMTEITALTGKAWLAILISTLLQASYHLYQGWFGALQVGVIFLVMSLYFARRGRILPVVLAHFYLDAIAFAYYWQRN
jgi:membrane protease YdiL (CAAX protease family)